MINIKDVPDKIAYGEAYDKYLFFTIVKKQGKLYIPFIINNGGEIRYNYDIPGNGFEELNGELISKAEFYNNIKRIEEKFKIKHIFIKTEI